VCFLPARPALRHIGWGVSKPTLLPWGDPHEGGGTEINRNKGEEATAGGARGGDTLAGPNGSHQGGIGEGRNRGGGKNGAPSGGGHQWGFWACAEGGRV